MLKQRFNWKITKKNRNQKGNLTIEEKQKEEKERYRDRAKERREGKIDEFAEAEPLSSLFAIPPSPSTSSSSSLYLFYF